MSPRDSELLVQRVVAEVRADPSRRSDLVDILREEHPCYANVGTPAVARMRGWIFHAFGEIGLPREALPYVTEQLESGIDPYVTAAAAQALSSLDRTDEHVALLECALHNLMYRDDMVSFARYGEYSQDIQGTTARRTVQQVLETVKCKPETSCCGDAKPVEQTRSGERPDELVLEDHDGQATTFADYFTGRPSVVVFFYTRCSNPHKCRLTVTKLGQVQKALADAPVRSAGFTYDPGFDNPARLRAYGESVDVQFTENHRLFRTSEKYDRLAAYFGLGVSRHGSVVSHHRIEAFVLDREGTIARTFTHRKWEVRELVDAAKALLLPTRFSRVGGCHGLGRKGK